MEEKEIFKTNFEYTWDEYKKSMMHYPRIYWGNTLVISVIEIFIIVIILSLLKIRFNLIIISLIVIVSNLIIFKLKLEKIIRNYYDKHKKQNLLPKETVTLFYDNYLIRKSDMRELKIEYKNINKIIETSTNFYFLCKKNILVPIIKSELKKENEEFIRNINPKVYKDKTN